MTKAQSKITNFFKKKTNIKVYGFNTKTEEWHCTECGISMGKNNPRQLCGKYFCDGNTSD
jgi:hypothetical protein